MSEAICFFFFSFFFTLLFPPLIFQYALTLFDAVSRTYPAAFCRLPNISQTPGDGRVGGGGEGDPFGGGEGGVGGRSLGSCFLGLNSGHWGLRGEGVGDLGGRVVVGLEKRGVA